MNEDDVIVYEDDSVSEVPAESSEVLSESQDVLAVASSDEAATPYSVDTPTYGSVNTTVLGYFDRIADGLPNDYVYVAFRDSSSDTYSGVMIYGRNYTYDGSSVVFGDDSVIVSADRVVVGQSGNQYTYAYSLTESYTDSQTVPVSVDGTTLYYTNVDVGYMRLGNGSNLNINFSPFICIGLISAAFCAVLTRLLSRR